MKKSNFFLTASLAAIIAFTSLSVIASADDGGEMPEAGERGEKRIEMQTALESRDYNAFAEVAPEQLLEKVNADNFDRFLEMHDHMEAAKAIAEELGIEKMGKHKGKMKGKFQEKRAELKEAIASGSYETFAEIAPEKMLEHINADNFDQLVEMHNALESQDFETAKEIAEELGLPKHSGKRNAQ